MNANSNAKTTKKTTHECGTCDRFVRSLIAAAFPCKNFSLFPHQFLLSDASRGHNRETSLVPPLIPYCPWSSEWFQGDTWVTLAPLGRLYNTPDLISERFQTQASASFALCPRCFFCSLFFPRKNNCESNIASILRARFGK